MHWDNLTFTVGSTLQTMTWNLQSCGDQITSDRGKSIAIFLQQFVARNLYIT
jgi:hypothetical protein